MFSTAKGYWHPESQVASDPQLRFISKQRNCLENLNECGRCLPKISCTSGKICPSGKYFGSVSWSNFSLILFLPFYRSNMRADWASLHLQLATMHHHHHRSPFDWLPLHYDLGSASSRQSGSMTLLLKTSSWPSDRWSSISLRWTYITLCSKSFQFCILPRDTSTSSASRLTHLTLVIRYSLLHII